MRLSDVSSKISKRVCRSLSGALKTILDILQRPAEQLPLLEQLVNDVTCSVTAIEAICPPFLWESLGLYRVSSPGEFVPWFGVDTGGLVPVCNSLYGSRGCGFDCGTCGTDCASCQI